MKEVIEADSGEVFGDEVEVGLEGSCTSIVVEVSDMRDAIVGDDVVEGQKRRAACPSDKRGGRQKRSQSCLHRTVSWKGNPSLFAGNDSKESGDAGELSGVSRHRVLAANTSTRVVARLGLGTVGNPIQYKAGLFVWAAP